MSECLFCKIINKDIPGDIVYEDDDILAFNDIDPKAPVHILIIPKKHISTFNDIKDYEISGKITEAIQKLVQKKSLENDGYRIVVNCNQHGGQAVYHLHYHLLGGRQMQWPPG
jgi:histidine triad (HIT) family protein